LHHIRDLTTREFEQEIREQTERRGGLDFAFSVISVSSCSNAFANEQKPHAKAPRRKVQTLLCGSASLREL
jgi:hypothetical protein